MKEIVDPKRLSRILDRLNGQGRRIGFVPTMGALHEGHLSLVRVARRENDILVASIFVNPAQFGPAEDYARYPKTLGHDRRLLREGKVDYLFHPPVKAMYPEGFSTAVSVGGASGVRLRPVPQTDFLTSTLCGRFRPGHFTGVATVVTKLLNIVRPGRVYFGAKDYQQAVVIRRLVKDLNLATEVRVLPTVREKDGLAMSSRNRYLAPSERRNARVIPETLFWLRREITGGRTDFIRLRSQAVRRLRKGVDAVQYLEFVAPETLEPIKCADCEIVAATACLIGKTRLIDNVIITRQRTPLRRQAHNIV